MSEETHTAARHEEPQEASHPKPITYVVVAMTLAIITAIEVAIFYVTGIGHAIIPVLVVLSAGKFALVAMFYMHLRYDARPVHGLLRRRPGACGLRRLRPDAPLQLLLGSEPARVSFISTREG